VSVPDVACAQDIWQRRQRDVSATMARNGYELRA
jgi:hypothetical protein